MCKRRAWPPRGGHAYWTECARRLQTEHVSTEPIADFFDRECCATAHANGGDEPDALGDLLIDALEHAGWSGGTVLEFGSGAGGLSRELVRRGAAAVTGIDLSPQSVSYATARASSLGFTDHLTYRVGDAARSPLDPHDAVVSEAVVCCYPDAAAVLANTLPIARTAYALALPESRGMLGLGVRFVVSLANGWQSLRRDNFRAYLHDVEAIDSTIRAAAFEPAFNRRHRHWRVLGYRRVQSPS
jgi:SAM-dependent methyltransferase